MSKPIKTGDLTCVVPPPLRLGVLICAPRFATGLEINRNRPDDKLPYDGAWLNVGSPSQMIHLMELPNPDPKEGRPKHGGRDRHACVSVKDVSKIKEVFDKAGMLKSGLYVSVHCITTSACICQPNHD